MNRRISQKVLQQFYKHNYEKNLLVKRNVTVNNRTYQTINYYKISEYRPTCLLSSKQLYQKTLCSSSLLVTNLHRNASTETAAAAKHVASANQPLPEAVPVEEVTLSFNEGVMSVIDEFSNSILTKLAVEYMVNVHVAFGLPWWASIAISAAMVRTAFIFPWAVNQFQIIGRYRKVELDMITIENRLKKEMVKTKKEFGWPDDLANEKYEEKLEESYDELIARENCHPIKTYLLLIVQAPVWLIFTSASYNLCHLTSHSLIESANVQSQMMTGGFGWVTDLTATDPYYVLPIAIGLMNLTVLQVHELFRTKTYTKRDKIKNAFFRTLSVSIAVSAAFTPAAVNIYWLSSSTYGLLQAFFLNSSPMRRVMSVPALHPEEKRPYRFFANNLKTQLSLGPSSSVVKK